MTCEICTMHCGFCSDKRDCEGIFSGCDCKKAEPRVAETPVTEGRCDGCGKEKCPLDEPHAVHHPKVYCHGSHRVAGGKSGEEKMEREVVEQCIAVVESYLGAKSEIGALFDSGWNAGVNAVVVALRELANR